MNRYSATSRQKARMRPMKVAALMLRRRKARASITGKKYPEAMSTWLAPKKHKEETTSLVS